jgi:SAM-dependent methyltransferase
MVDREAARSVPAIARSIMRDLAPRTALDIGCGTGALLNELRRAGVTCSGYEYSEAGLALCRERGLDVHQFDLESDAPDPTSTPVDVVVSTEVAEHLPERLAERYVDRLCRRGRVIVFTAATPGQGGRDHVNEQPHAYWQEKIAARGWSFDVRLSVGWRAEWERADTAPWYASNLMIFRRVAR